MNSIYYLNSYIKNIDGSDYYCIFILDLKNCQVFNFYHKADDKCKNFLSSLKTFDNISEKLTFVIKRNNKISFDIK